MRLSDLVADLDGVVNAEVGDDPVLDAVVFDSREAREGALFAALVGARADGHDHAESAIRAGASALLTERSLELATPHVVVDDTRARLGEVARLVYGDPSAQMTVIGITGTNGKTTVSYLVERVLAHAGRPTGVLGTVNYRWPGHLLPAANTTPESAKVQSLLARMRDDGVTTVAMEVSSHGLATHRLEGTSFDVGVFTNLSQDHLDFHHTMEEYRRAKERLFSLYLPRAAAAGKSPVAVVNADDDEGARLGRMSLDDVRFVSYSATGKPVEWRCERWSQSIEGTRMRVAHPGGVSELHTRLLGEFNVSNVLATLAATVSVGVPVEVAAEALEQMRGVPGRLEHLGGGGRPDVFVDYAHTPDALGRALDALRPLTRGRLVVVFGCGGDRDREKRPLMGSVAAERADFVLLTSDNPRTESPQAIIAEIETGMPGAATDDLSAVGWGVVVEREPAIVEAIRSAQPGDVILIAGKGHETYQEVHGVRRPFDDVAIASRTLK